MKYHGFMMFYMVDMVVSTPLKNITFITFIGLQQGSIDKPAAQRLHAYAASIWYGVKVLISPADVSCRPAW